MIFFCTFIKLITYFCISLINLIKNAKDHFLLMKKLINTESAQLCIGASKACCKSQFVGNAPLLAAAAGDRCDGPGLGRPAERGA